MKVVLVAVTSMVVVRVVEIVLVAVASMVRADDAATACSHQVSPSELWDVASGVDALAVCADSHTAGEVEYPSDP